MQLHSEWDHDIGAICVPCYRNATTASRVLEYRTMGPKQHGITAHLGQ